MDEDEMLADYVRAVNADPDGAMGVTLWVPGGCVSGMMVGWRKYMQALVTAFRQSPSGDARAAAVHLDHALDNELAPDAEAAEGDGPGPAGVVLLIDAKVLSGGQWLPRGDGVLWRGKLRDVSAWSWGMMR